jgi:predicted deacetylase
MKALLSIHDCMPETLERVLTLIEWLQSLGVPPLTLLVVPGKNWTARQLEQLHRWVKQGHTLAAHGWYHQTQPRRAYHRLHAYLLSRNVAEHLDLNSTEILNLLCRAKAWFSQHALPEPELYVPPAWALGTLHRNDLAKAPYCQIETTRGLYQIHNQRIQRQSLPLVGYEADTTLRAAFLRRWNQAQAGRAQRRQLPLRISIHPDDLQLRLADQMKAQLCAVTEFLDYRDVSPD